MNNLVPAMLERPIATILIVGCFSNGLANIISSVRGCGTTPIIQFTLNKGETKK